MKRKKILFCFLCCISISCFAQENVTKQVSTKEAPIEIAKDSINLKINFASIKNNITQDKISGSGIKLSKSNLGLKTDFNLIKYKSKSTEDFQSTLAVTNPTLTEEILFVKRVTEDILFTNNIIDEPKTIIAAQADSKKVSINVLENFSLVKQMQNLAFHISDKYKIPLINAEKIVLTTYQESQSYNIDPIFFLSLISIESKFQQFVSSKAGAIGLAQIIPKYHKDNIEEVKEETGKTNIWDIDSNIKLGLKVINKYINISRGNVVSALQYYNGSIYDKNKAYSNKILREQKNLKTVALNGENIEVN